MTLKEITDKKPEDFVAMNKQELQDYIDTASKFAKTRKARALASIKKNNLPMPFIYSENKTYKASRVYQTKTGEVEHEYQAKSRAQNLDFYSQYDQATTKSELVYKASELNKFLNSETSTIGGWRKTMTKVIRKVETQIAKYMELDSFHFPRKFYKDFWEIMNRIENETLAYSSHYEAHRVVIETMKKRGNVLQGLSDEEKATYILNILRGGEDNATQPSNFNPFTHLHK